MLAVSEADSTAEAGCTGKLATSSAPWAILLLLVLSSALACVWTLRSRRRFSTLSAVKSFIAQDAENHHRERRIVFYLTTGEVASAGLDSSAWILPSSAA